MTDTPPPVPPPEPPPEAPPAPRKGYRRAVAGLAGFALFAAAVAGVALVSGGSDHASAFTQASNTLAGVHVIHQVPQAAGGTLAQAQTQLTQQTTAIRSALAVPGVVAFGVRVPWNIIEKPDGSFDPTILNQARAIVNTPGDTLTVRFMAGRHTPDRYLTGTASSSGALCPTFTSGGEKAPAPFTSTGAPNTCFLAGYDAIVDDLDAWARSNNVHEIHLSHYANQWAEFYWGPEVQAILGSGTAGQNAMVTATNALVDVGVAHADDAVSYELPMSGHGPIMRSTQTSPPGIAERVADHIVETTGAESGLFFIQGNGWDQDGIWGASTEATEALMDRVLDDPRPLLGVQMIQPQQYTWSSVFAEATRHEATYGEIYLPSFSGTTTQNAALRAAIAAWDPYGPVGPGGTQPTTTTTTTAPTTTTTTLPPTTTTTLPPTTTTTLPPTTTTTTIPVGPCEAFWNGTRVQFESRTEADCRLATV
jgi:hypothetical protein